MDDLLGALGLGGLRRRRPLELFFRVPVRRLARQIATYDGIVGESGLGAGGAWALERMVRRAEIEGRERVPKVAIFTCAKRLTAPSADEGIDEIHVWRVSETGAFSERAPQ